MATPIPSNRAEFSRREIAEVTGASSTFGASRADERCIGVTTDSRGDVAGKLFVALRGETFDGQRFVADVLGRGAFGVIVESAISDVDPGLVFEVPSTIAALGALARHRRRQWNGRIVTVGGSAGKTTTRSAIYAMLDSVRPGRVLGTVGNLNNLIGVPMTLLGLESHHELAVVELGTNSRGEMATLAAICEADAAVLTCVGLEHTAGLGDLDGVEAEERDLFRDLREGAIVCGNVDDERVRRTLSAFPRAAQWTYGQTSLATHRIVERSVVDLSRATVRILRQRTVERDEVEIVTRLFGLPGALASAAAVAVADALLGDLAKESLRNALDRELGEAGRLKVVERSDRALIVDDCYNANPVSMRSSIAVAKELAASRGSRLHLVIGDMLELGELSAREHEGLTEELSGVTTVTAVGDEMARLAGKARRLGLAVEHVRDAEGAGECVQRLVGSGDVVLVKGSRGMRLERVVRLLVGAKAEA